MSEKNLSQKIINGMKWKTIERVSLQIVNAVTPIFLARLLTPDDFGIIAILSVFISLANTFVNNGLTNSIVQKKDSDNLDCSTVYYTQFTISVVCYFVLFLAAPYIAHFYNSNELTLMLRVMSLSLVIGAFGAMQITILKQRMMFHKSFFATISGTVSYGVVGILCAYNGLGCWSLIYAALAQSTALSLINIMIIKWRPDFAFSLKRLKNLFSYSWKLTVGWLIGTIHQDLYTLIIGKRFNSATLGYYNRAGSFPQIFHKTIIEVVDGVMFPALSSIQDEKERFKNMARTLLSMNSFLIFPVFFGLSAITKPLIIFLLTDKWLMSVDMMRIVCITYSLTTLNHSNMQIFNSIGRSDIFMKFELFKRTISIILLFITSFINIYAVISVLLLMSVMSNLMNSYQNNKLIGYSYKEQLKDILPSLVSAFITAVMVFLISTALENIISSLIIVLIIDVLSGAGIYVAISFVINRKTILNFIDILKSFLKKKKA